MTRFRRPLRAACILAAAALAVAGAAPAQATPSLPGQPTARTERVSVGLGQAQPDGASQAGGLSADGRYAVFTSDATNLVPGDTNGKSDVFVRDLWTGRTERVDTGPDGAQADGASYEATISGNGRYVAFSSSATDLAPGAVLGAQDVYVHDRWTGRTRLVSTARTPGAPQPNKVSAQPSISWDGLTVAYQSNRSDLAPGTVTWFGGNIYVSDLRTGATALVSVGADGREADASSSAPEISADGGTVVFISKATNIIGAGQPDALSPDAVARLAAGSDAEFTADTLQPNVRPGVRQDVRPNVRQDVRPDDKANILKPRTYPLYVRDLRAARTRLASPDGSGGYRGVVNPSISPDGRYAVYSSWVLHGDSEWDRHFEVYARDLALGTEMLVSVGLPGTKTTAGSYAGRMTADDRWVFFSSEADNLVPGDTDQASDVFRRDLWTGRTERVDLADDGSQGAGSDAPFVNAFGTAVVFTSSDGSLVPGDTNHVPDVFLRRLPLF
ncbi:hypothetical protein AB0D10_14620 [Kitasatospora sp. NPDC048545]|uniref:hypothetical protein n=1 Tax=Kitasatospora sp. NPDC048545 TaxID=3157208 RepID=UPI0033CCE391